MVELTFEVVNEEGDRRRFKRFDTQRKARYFFKEGSGCWQECTIINISRKGVGVRFPLHEKITMGSTILLKVFYSAETEPTSVIGMIRWMRKRKNDFIGGIESIKVLDDESIYYSPLEK
jgi:hypothetical protein